MRRQWRPSNQEARRYGREGSDLAPQDHGAQHAGRLDPNGEEGRVPLATRPPTLFNIESSRRISNGEDSQSGSEDLTQQEEASLHLEFWRNSHFDAYHTFIVLIAIFIGVFSFCFIPVAAGSVLPGSMLLAPVVGAPLRIISKLGKPHHLRYIFSFVATMFVCIRLRKDHALGAARMDVPNPAMLIEYSMDIVRPVIFGVSMPVMGMPSWLYAPILFAYSCTLFMSTSHVLTKLSAMSLNACTQGEVQINIQSSSSSDRWYMPSEDTCTCAIVPVALFGALLASVTYNERQSNSKHEFMRQRERAHIKERAAKQQAIQSELRAREAEQAAHEQDLQMRNKYLGAMCHDFGTPVAVLQMLLLQLRRRLRRGQERSTNGSDAARASVERDTEIGESTEVLAGEISDHGDSGSYLGGGGGSGGGDGGGGSGNDNDGWGREWR